MKTITIMKLEMGALLILAAGCAGPGTELTSGPLPSDTSFVFGKKIINYRVPAKEIVFHNSVDTDLDTVGKIVDWATVVEFPETTFLGSTVRGDGRVVATYKLGPVNGYRTIKKVVAEGEERYWRQELIVKPSNEVIHITSSHLKGIPLGEFNVAIYVAGSGPNKGQVVQMWQFERECGVVAKSSSRLSNGKWKVVYANPRSKGTFTMIVHEGEQHISPQRPRIDGDGTVLRLDGAGWRYGKEGLGGGSADYSFLEAKSKSGEFD